MNGDIVFKERETPTTPDHFGIIKLIGDKPVVINASGMQVGVIAELFRPNDWQHVRKIRVYPKRNWW